MTHFWFAFSGNPRYFLTSSLQTTLISPGERAILSNPSRIWFGRVRMLLWVWSFCSTSGLLIFPLRIGSFVIPIIRVTGSIFLYGRIHHSGRPHWETALPLIISTYPFWFHILIISYVTLLHNPGINIPNSSASRILSSISRRSFLFDCQDPGSNLKGSTKLRILADPRESFLQETRIWDCFLTDIVRIFCENILRASRKFSPFHTGSWLEKMHFFAGSWRFKSVKDPARKPELFLTESLLSFWLWSWSMS